MEDRLYRGFVAGAVGGVVSNILSHSFKVLDQAIMQHPSSLELLAHPAAKLTDNDNNEIDGS